MKPALASLPVLVWVLVIGSLADLYTPEARTAFALGIVAVCGPFVVADKLLGRGKQLDLDAAWSEAEAALPDDGYIINLHSMLDRTYVAGAHSARDGYPKPTYLAHDGLPTPAAALRALAVLLRERVPFVVADKLLAGGRRG